MYYSTIGILAALVLLIENQDIFQNRNDAFTKPAWKVYRKFLYTILIYYITDILWGALEYFKLPTPLFIDTSIYFVTMAFGVLLWTQYVVVYMNQNKFMDHFLLYAGRAVAVFAFVVTIINIFIPVLFDVDDKCVYYALPLRYVLLILQMMLLLLISVYALNCLIRKNVTNELRQRNRTMAAFGLIMAIFLFLQMIFAYLPMYAIAYMLGTCLLRAAVIGYEKEEYAANYRKAQGRVNVDALTGVKTKYVYLEAEERLNDQIKEGINPQFAIVILDINDLKKINDTLGHKAGDKFIQDACRYVAQTFKHSPVFRVGGDEFAVISQGEDYDNIDELIEGVNEHNIEAVRGNGIVVACGMAKNENDDCVSDVYERADMKMYANKSMLKNGTI